jgi:8-oxo-dGTP diphosphatase
MTKRTVESAVAIIQKNDGRILLTKRDDSLRSFPGLWCLPGGKLSFGETPEQAAIRETSEEVGLHCNELTLFGRFESEEPDTGLHYKIDAFTVMAWSGRVNIEGALQEVSAYAWVLPSEALNKLPIAGSATKNILRKLR